MQISNENAILSLLKTWYAKDGVTNLMFRNSPVVKQLSTVRVEGKTQNFAAMYGRGGAAGGSYTAALAKASTVSKNVEFSVAPGQIFSVYSINAKEVQASLSKRGAYMKVAGNKMFAASESFRKTAQAAFYGRGFGELCFSPTTALTANTAVDITLPADAIMKIDIGTDLVIKNAVNSTSTIGGYVVNKIDGTTVNVTPTTTVTPVATDVICLANSMDSSGNALLPMGLAGWLPTVGSRTGSDWTSYIGTSFFGVTRSIASDRLAGQYVKGAASTDKISDLVQKLLLKCRRAGSAADLIVMNDEDFLTLSQEIQTTNTYFTQTSTKGKRAANVGFNDFSASFSTNYIENIIDDPYCPKGRFYILDKSAVELWSYTNVDKLNDGVAGNEPGKPDAMKDDADGHENDPYKLLISDYLSVQPGTAGQDGPSTDIGLNAFFSYVVTNPSVCGIGETYDTTAVA